MARKLFRRADKDDQALEVKRAQKNAVRSEEMKRHAADELRKDRRVDDVK